jgi:RNA polymerase sigma-70 factor (ECF subfamily)
MSGPTGGPRGPAGHSDDADGLPRLYADCGAAVYSLALHVTGSPDAAAEITYDVFIDVGGSPHQASMPNRSPRARLAAAAHERAVRSARRARSASSARSAGESPPLDGRVDAQQLARSLTAASYMGGAAAALAPQQRLVLALTYSAGRTIDETARILGLRRSTVLRQLTSGLQLLAGKRPQTAPGAGCRHPQTSSPTPSPSSPGGVGRSGGSSTSQTSTRSCPSE